MKKQPPTNIPLKELLPEKTVLLMGAGPVPIPAEVASANTMVVSHLGDTMKTIIARLKLMAQYVFQTESEKILGISGPSSAAMEMAVTSLLWPGRKVLVLNMGTFSARFSELATGVGAEVTEIFPSPLSAFEVDDVKNALEKKSFDVLTIVQGETSCGIKNVNLKEIVALAKNYNVQTIVDGVCTLSTMPLPMDDWGIDILVTGGQKGLSCIPGISLIAFSEKIFQFISERKVIMPHWCLDARRAHKFWGLGEYHYTAPVPGILAMHEALRLICLETLEKRFLRHEQSCLTLQVGLKQMGFELYAPETCRLTSVLAVKKQGVINTKELIQYMITQHGVEISGAFGLDIFRVGQMGEQCRAENVKSVLDALYDSHQHFGVKLSR
ncbi:MAG: pyridoxal-phosphate-dependent aminotransferase family protein [Bacteriovoracaceae bacterium]